MRGLAEAALLAVVAIGTVAAAPALVRASWPRRSPAAAILLWQAVGLAGGIAAVGCLFGLALPGGYGSVAGGMVHEAAGLHLVAARGIPGLLIAGRLASLVAGVVLLALLCWVLVAATAAVFRARRRQRALLALLAHGDPKVPGALVVDHPAAAAYCLPGLRSKIVVSAGALDLLGPAELAAVLAHERAHLRERHDLVLLPFTALLRAFPRWARCAEAFLAVALLVEMLADDRALRTRRGASDAAAELVSALVRFGTASQVPAGALAAVRDESEVAARVHRLLRPVRPLPAAATAGICLGAALLAAAPVALLLI
jgi:Zn-dependent protease with chaperone function